MNVRPRTAAPTSTALPAAEAVRPLEAFLAALAALLAAYLRPAARANRALRANALFQRLLRAVLARTANHRWPLRRRITPAQRRGLRLLRATQFRPLPARGRRPGAAARRRAVLRLRLLCRGRRRPRLIWHRPARALAPRHAPRPIAPAHPPPKTAPGRRGLFAPS